MQIFLLFPIFLMLIWAMIMLIQIQIQALSKLKNKLIVQKRLL